MNVIVVGAGVAGVAAAWALQRGGAKVTLVHDRPGASALGSGAIDLEPWDTVRSSHPIDPDSVQFAKAMGWALDGNTRVATSVGLLRPARGRDAALLDVTPLSGKRIAVADVGREDWDAALVARALGESRWAKQTQTRFFSAKLDMLRADQERHIGTYDFASLHDDTERRERLVRELTHASANVDGWLLGPWLGVLPETAEKIRGKLGRAIGEVMSHPGGAVGARFVVARNRLLRSIEAQVIHAPATALARRNDAWELAIEIDGKTERVSAERAILAVGGVAIGGIVIDPARPDHIGGASFRLSLDAPVQIEIDDRAIDGVSSLHGFSFDALGLSVLDRVGIRTRDGLAAAGDCLPGRPRTVLEAVRAGIRAAKSVLAS